MSRSTITTLGAALLLAIPGLSSTVRAGVLHVPGDAPTIQQAIDAASNGDTILVAPGTYAETIDFLGKRLVVESQGGAAVTIIDAGGTGTVVTVDGGEPHGTALRGFTITDGAIGTLIEIPSQFGTYTAMCGGGVFVGMDAHLEVVDCLITGNEVSSPTLDTFGGGLFAFASRVSLVGCTLSGNTAEEGAGVASEPGAADLSLRDCTVTGNTAGAASYASAVRFGSGINSLADCLITDNTGNGIRQTGGGFQTTITDTSLSGNTGWGYWGFGPVGVDLYGCSFLGNGLGGAALQPSGISNAVHFVGDCVFAAGDNLSTTSVPTELTRCTFDGAHIVSNNKSITVQNSIFRNMVLVAEGASSLTVTYCNVEGGSAGAGNIDADPLWVNAAAQDYHLTAGSPCIDAGDPSSALEPDLSLTDMGALPYAMWDNLGGGVHGSTEPALGGQGLLIGGETVGLLLTNAPPLKSTVLILGGTALGASFKGGVLWPMPDLVLSGLVTDGAGKISLAGTCPSGLPTGFTVYAQFWFKDAVAPFGSAGANGVVGTAP